MSEKYPKTFHLPWSPGATNDDKIAKDVSGLLNVPIVITEKADGGNTSMEHSGIYARTHAYEPSHPSFDILKQLHASLRYSIPEHYQFFGENVYAQHSIAYSELPGYFLLFAIRDLGTYYWLSWEEIELWAEKLGIPTVPVLFEGTVHSESDLQNLTEDLCSKPSKLGGEREGVVVRVHAPFSDERFDKCCMKIVRKNHVQTDEHWASKKIVKNGLKQ